MNNAKIDETCRCKYVDRWLDAHEKYFRILPTVPNVPNQVEYHSEPLPFALPFVPNNTQCAFSMLQSGIPKRIPPKAEQLKFNSSQPKGVANTVQLSAKGSKAVHLNGSNGMNSTTLQPQGVHLNQMQSFVNPKYGQPYAVHKLQPNVYPKTMQRNVMYPNSVQRSVTYPNTVQRNTTCPEAAQQNIEQSNIEQSAIFAARSDLVVQPPHRISPLNWKKTVYYPNM